jgi:hypothetical protein
MKIFDPTKMNLEIVIRVSRKFLLLIFILYLFGNLCTGQVKVYDVFESGKLSDIWNTSRMVANSIEFQSEIVKKGKMAAKITVRTNDTFEAGKSISAPTERDELLVMDAKRPGCSR